MPVNVGKNDGINTLRAKGQRGKMQKRVMVLGVLGVTVVGKSDYERRLLKDETRQTVDSSGRGGSQ